MATINLGSDPNMDPGTNPPVNKPETPNTTGAAGITRLDLGKPAEPTKPSNPASVSINFTPVITSSSGAEKTPATTAQPAVGENKPQLVSMEIKRADLKTTDEKIAAKPEEKKGLLGSLFGKKEKIQTKPSSAWGDAIDAPKDINKQAAATATALPKPVLPAAPTTPTAPVTPAAPVVQAAPLPPIKVPEIKNPDVAPPEKPAEIKSDFFKSAALQEKSGSSKLVENIASQKAKLEQPKVEELLGKKSTILEKSIEQEAILKMKKKLMVIQFMAFFVTVVAVAVNGYLYFQLSPGLNIMGFNYNFDSNLRNDIFNLNQSLRSTQTDLNKYRYLSGQLYLNQFGYESTRFIDGVANLESPGVLASDKINIQTTVDDAKSKMPDLLAGAKENLAQPVVVATYPTRGETQSDPTLQESEMQSDLKTAISNEKSALLTASAQNNQEVPGDQLSFFDNALKLVGNTKLVTNLNSSTVDAFKLEADDYQTNSDPAQRLAFRTYIDNLLASTKVNLATINNLRNSRISWSDVLDAVDRITNQVNSEHNSGLGSGNASTITYSNFSFNSKNGSISISANNTTQSGTNREVVTYLIEALEASPEFKNVADRTFPLTKSIDANGNSTYIMTFSISMEIEKGAFSKMNSPIADIQNAQKVAQNKVAVKHKK
jgi:hypothetical protein